MLDPMGSDDRSSPPRVRTRGLGHLRGEIEVEAVALDDAGAGVAAHGGFEIRVADLLPGERAVVTVDRVSRHHRRAWATIARRTGALALERSTPPCPAFGRCGGCPWQRKT